MIEITTKHPYSNIIKQLPMANRRQAANVTYAKSRDFEIQFTVISKDGNQKVNGFCTVARRKSDNEYLIGVYVTPEARRQGIGKELASAAIAEASQRNWDVVGEAITPEGLALVRSVPGLTIRSTDYAKNSLEQWGGKREGAGRPSTLKDAVRVTIWLEAEQLVWVKAQGEQGEVIRRLIDEARNDTPK